MIALRFGLALTLFSALFSAGCIAKECEGENGQDAICLETPVRYDGDAGFDSITYERGLGVDIDGVYGDISVTEGPSGQVRVTFDPFAYAGQNEGSRAARAIDEKARYPELTIDGDLIVIKSGRTDGKIPLVGMDLEIELPPEFDGPIVARNRGDGSWNPGDLDLNFVGDAPSVEVSSDSLIECEITGGPQLVYTRARCGDSIRAIDVNDTVDLVSTGGFGDVQVAIASISPFAEDSRIHAEDGEVQVIFPSGFDFSLTAQAAANASSDLSDIEGVCQTASSAESAKSATCGEGGPLYELSSDSGDVRVSIE